MTEAPNWITFAKPGLVTLSIFHHFVFISKHCVSLGDIRSLQLEQHKSTARANVESKPQGKHKLLFNKYLYLQRFCGRYPLRTPTGHLPHRGLQPLGQIAQALCPLPFFVPVRVRESGVTRRVEP